MKRGLKALAVLAATAMALAGPQAFAVCNDHLAGYPIFQCAEQAYFGPPPAGSGAVTARFFQLGFGNGTLETGLGTAGTGMSSFSEFNGNDNGQYTVDLADALAVIGDSRVPAGSLCLRSNNWANAGVDGCCDNPRSQAQPFSDDGILNPEYNVAYKRNYGYEYASLDWVQDYPLAVLLTEASGSSFALAAVATGARSGPSDVLKGEYNFKAVSNGGTNPITAASNIVPWQSIPGNGAFVTAANYSNPADLSSDRLLDLSWSTVDAHSDGSVRPSTNSTVATGVGVADMGSLVRYVVETQTVPNGAADPFPQLVEGNWVAASTHFNPTSSVSGLQVPINTCVRLHTIFGKVPQTSTHSVPNCRLGQCGDLGYGVVSHPACIGGPLIADGVPQNLNATRGKGKVDVSWTTDSELTVQRFEIGVVEKDGSVRNLQSVSCKRCSDGQGDAYSVSLSMGDLKGGRTIQVKAVGPNATKSANIK